METQIKELQNYFTNKILNGEFEVVKVDKYTIKILIDDKYPFEIWVMNGTQYRDYTKTYISNGGCFMSLEFTQKQSSKVYTLFSKIRKEHWEKQGRREKQKEFNKLKKELGL